MDFETVRARTESIKRDMKDHLCSIGGQNGELGFEAVAALGELTAEVAMLVLGTQRTKDLLLHIAHEVMEREAFDDMHPPKR